MYLLTFLFIRRDRLLQLEIQLLTVQTANNEVAIERCNELIEEQKDLCKEAKALVEEAKAKFDEAKDHRIQLSESSSMSRETKNRSCRKSQKQPRMMTEAEKQSMAIMRDKNHN